MRQYTRQLEFRSNTMIPIRDLFEAHLTVKDLQRSMRFFGDALGLNWRKYSRKERLRSTG
jgi:predicted enzyme related to lactoylglutathione lyase